MYGLLRGLRNKNLGGFLCRVTKMGEVKRMS